jgi:protein farnesyltransferase subunit beta
MATTYLIPPHLTTLPPIRDSLVTETSEWQDDTAEMCLPFLTAQSPEHPYYNTHGVPHLRRAEHIRFCHKALEPLPAGFVAADAARPWFFYWNICALAVLGEDVSTLRERMINTARPLQNATGGFAGGYGQLSHLAPTYATVLALGMVGGEEAIGIIDRKAMWEWLCKLKQPNGGFQLSVGGEVDVR